jgi:hypothetical protein
VCGWSVGYLVPAGKALRRKDGVRVIREMDAHEYSPVLFGMASLAHTLAVKSAAAAVAGGVPLMPPEDVILAMGDAGILPVTPAHRPVLQVKRDFTQGQRQAAADDGHALSDGSYPIKNVEDLKNAISAYGRCPEGKRTALRRLIMRRAFDLGVPEKIPDAWKKDQGKGKKASGGLVSGPVPALEHPAPYIVPAGWAAAVKAGAPGVADTPSDERSARQLIHWYEHGEGAAEIRWGEDGDFMRCVRIAGKHMDPERAKGFCSNRHHGALGVWPGQEGGPGHKSKGDKVHTATEVLESKAYPHLPGSYEEQMEAVRQAVIDAFKAAEKAEDAAEAMTEQSPGADTDDDGGSLVVSLAGTWPDHAVVTVFRYANGDTTPPKSFDVPYTIDGTGAAQLGQPTPVELTVSVAPVAGSDTGSAWDDGDEAPAGDAVPVLDSMVAAQKIAETLLYARQTKAGRVLSSRLADMIGQAYRQLAQVLAAAGVNIGDSGTGNGTGNGAAPAGQDGGQKALVTAEEFAEAQALIAAAAGLVDVE